MRESSDRTVLNKSVEVGNDNVAITEEIRIDYNKQQIEDRLAVIRRNKARVIEENARLVAEYNDLVVEEVEFKQYLMDLTNDTPPEIIE